MGPATDAADLPAPDPEALSRARALVADAERVVVLAGAGISTDSGIADFRGPNGLWTKDPDAEKTSDISYYVADPAIRAKAWQGRLRWFERRLEPNDGHRALVELERQGRLAALVIQNIDGLHHAAGHDPSLVVEVHGTVRDVVCLDCGDRGPMGPALDRVRAGEVDPDCRACGGMLKSATVSFGQSLDPDDLRRAFEAAAACDLLLAVGSSLGVYPVADLVPTAAGRGARVVIVNGQPTPMDPLADVVVRGSLSHVLPALVAADGLGNT